MSTEQTRETWETYVKSWKLEGESAKLEQFRHCLDEACVYTDPLTVEKGHQALCRYMLEFHQQVPGEATS